MRALGWLGAVIAVLALLLKLFTYEFLLRDDATVGLALRSVPSLISRLVVEHSPSPHLILVQSENDFMGSGLYESLAHWGWIVLVIVGIAVALASRRNKPVGGRSGQAAS
jgi:hypothetical protein